MTISESRARELAEEFLRTAPLATEFALLPQAPARRGNVVYFGCQSAAYLRTGHWSDLAVGNGPVAVDLNTGACRMLSSVEARQSEL